MELTTQCCVAGGGPAGLILGLLLARGGVDVVVLEKHGDFLRDFRGDTIQPSTLNILDDLGLLEAFLRLPHQEVETLTGFVEEEPFVIADFRKIDAVLPFIALLPQWDFLDFIAGEAARHPNFRLIRRAEARELIHDRGRVVGLRAETPDGALEVACDLVVGADGRRSTIRAAAGFEVETLGAPMDVVWFRLPRREGDGEATGGRFSAGGLFVTIYRGDYWQCALVIPKGGWDAVKAAGLDAFRERIARLAPPLADRGSLIDGWDKVSVLSVAVDRLKRWHAPGVLCIGDAAHAMSPIGGVGINLAIQDAVAAANILAEPLRQGRASDDDLARVQERRLFPTRVIQRLQIAVQNRVVSPVLASTGRLRPPLALRLMRAVPALRAIPARIVGIGVRPERVKTPAVATPR
ncbi:FAD-dependent oxidoreductase [Chelatococcus sambhunathii]|uniref:FAD-dependent oxidoreductase n=1 Tax=Chelatococcus sambhunathii TaxID=363953 RepID=A0ABU1DG74_9HYPH|nr:FAD-dependent oxidoreductase [Chelatococcus sambhunathii]MDR4307056.1 FAD-dependent oxidoreductase [Chelatococcus sambhunathii]